jgi:MFS family permease
VLSCGTAYLNVSSFYPLYVNDKYPGKINSTIVSICLAAFEFAGFIFTPIHGYTISKIGRKNAILMGFTLLILSTTALGMIALIDPEKEGNYKIFIIASFFTRFL